MVFPVPAVLGACIYAALHQNATTYDLFAHPVESLFLGPSASLCVYTVSVDMQIFGTQCIQHAFSLTRCLPHTLLFTEVAGTWNDSVNFVAYGGFLADVVFELLFSRDNLSHVFA